MTRKLLFLFTGVLERNLFFPSDSRGVHLIAFHLAYSTAQPVETWPVGSGLGLGNPIELHKGRIRRLAVWEEEGEKEVDLSRVSLNPKNDRFQSFPNCNGLFWLIQWRQRIKHIHFFKNIP